MPIPGTIQTLFSGNLFSGKELPLLGCLFAGLVFLKPAWSDCLQEVQETEHGNRLCLVQQKYSTECDRIEQDKFNAVATCHLPGTDGAVLTETIQHAAAAVHGDPADSLYRKGLSKIEERNELLRLSDHRWNAFFGDLLGTLREDNFDTKDCPLAFEGQSGRFSLISYTSLPVKEDLGIYLGPVQNDVTHLYVMPMRDKLCYGITSRMQSGSIEDDQPNQVYNLSQSDLQQLQAKPLDQPSRAGFRGRFLVSICMNAQTCLEEQKKIASAWTEYKSLIHRISAEEDCSRYAEANASGEINLQQLNNVNCSAADLAKKTKADHERSRQLASVLFAGSTAPTHH